MDESNAPTNRRAQRSNVLLSATIEFGSASLAVKLRNLSEQGALIEGKNLPVEGSEVTFKRNDLSVAGHVAWVSDTQAGIAFCRPLPTQEVLRNVSQPKPRVQPEYKRPPLNPRALSKHEQAAMEHWLRLMATRRP
jgi:hypothetical protein